MFRGRPGTAEALKNRRGTPDRSAARCRPGICVEGTRSSSKPGCDREKTEDRSCHRRNRSRRGEGRRSTGATSNDIPAFNEVWAPHFPHRASRTTILNPRQARLICEASAARSTHQRAPGSAQEEGNRCLVPPLGGAVSPHVLGDPAPAGPVFCPESWRWTQAARSPRGRVSIRASSIRAARDTADGTFARACARHLQKKDGHLLAKRGARANNHTSRRLLKARGTLAAAPGASTCHSAYRGAALAVPGSVVRICGCTSL